MPLNAVSLSVIIVTVGLTVRSAEFQQQNGSSSLSPGDDTVDPLVSPFWTNGTLEGLVTACSTAEKRCLRVRRLVDVTTERCFPLGDVRPCTGRGVWALNPEALREGHAQGHCHLAPSCDPPGIRMAYNGRCYTHSYVYSHLCSTDAHIVFHLFGNWECARAGGTDNSVQIMQSPGSCTVPPLRDSALRARVRCDVHEAECASRNELPISEGVCVQPLIRGPCTEGERAVLDAQALLHNKLRARCAPQQPCGPDRRLVYGVCQSVTQLNETLCPGEEIVELPTGESRCSGPSAVTSLLRISEISHGEFEVTIKFLLGSSLRSSTRGVSSLKCSRNDKSQCQSSLNHSRQKNRPLSIED